jgi:hypothetical protein
MTEGLLVIDPPETHRKEAITAGKASVQEDIGQVLTIVRYRELTRSSAQPAALWQSPRWLPPDD